MIVLKGLSPTNFLDTLSNQCRSKAEVGSLNLDGGFLNKAWSVTPGVPPQTCDKLRQLAARCIIGTGLEKRCAMRFSLTASKFNHYGQTGKNKSNFLSRNDNVPPLCRDETCVTVLSSCLVAAFGKPRTSQNYLLLQGQSDRPSWAVTWFYLG